MKAVRSIEILVNFYQTEWRHTQEDSALVWDFAFHSYNALVAP
jgi:hypothetical protein